MQKRILSAIPALLLLATGVYLHGYFLVAALWIVALLSEHEVIQAAKKGGVALFETLLYIGSAALAPVFVFFGFAAAGLFFMLFITAVCIAAVLQKQPSLKKMAYTIVLFIYPQAFYFFLIAIAALPDANTSRVLILFLFASAILTDSFSYFTGITIGKRKLCPAISPHKTIEGAAGGLFGGLAAALLMGLLVQSLLNVHIALLHYLVLGIIMSILSIMGDLAASLIKREFGVKDYGGIMPGHGGIMDRLDSVIFIAPVLFYYFIYFVQISV